MENIHLNLPYKIIPSKHKRYSAYYTIPAAESIVVPRKKYGDQISCDIFWKNESGEIQYKANLMFDSGNIEPVNALKDYILNALWEGTGKEVTVTQ